MVRVRHVGLGLVAAGALTKSDLILILSILVSGLGMLIDYLERRKE